MAVDASNLPRRQCRAYHPSGVRCQTKVVEGTAHLEDHQAPDPTDPAMTLNWSNLVAVPDPRLSDPTLSAEAVRGRLAENGIGNGSARLGQVGGEHYKKHKIQPWDVWDEYDLDRYTANAVKYLLRGGDKPGNTRLQDLRKARHYLDKAIEMEEGAGDQT
jgi:hypothetical protein